MEKHEEWELVVRAFAQTSGVGWQRAQCTVCEILTGKEDKKESLGFNPETGGYSCFKCSIKGRLPPKYREQLGSYEVEPQLGPEPLNVIEPAEGYVPLYDPPGSTASILQFYRDYLEIKRGLSPVSLQAGGVGAVLRGRLSGRVIVPLRDYAAPSGPWRGWVGRDCTGMSDLPYRYSKGLKRDGYLYNELALYVETEMSVFVVEGTLDALALWPDAVAVLGKPLDSQIEKFKKANRPVVVCLDGDAWSEGYMLAMKLRFLGVHAGNVRLKPQQDPDEVSRDLLDIAARRSLELEESAELEE